VTTDLFLKIVTVIWRDVSCWHLASCGW